MRAITGEREPATLVVADADLAEALRPTLGGQLVTVDHYLDALGEMSRRDVRAVVGRLEPMTGSLESTVRALRLMAPEAKLLLVIDAADEPQAMRAVRLGVDDYLVRPLGSDMVMAALEGRKVAAPMVADEPAPEAPAQTAAAPTAMPEIHVDPFDMERAGRADSPGIPGLDVPLADVHIVEQILRERRGMRDMAVRLIRQRVGGDDVVYSPEPVAGKNSVPVRFESIELGYLVSDTSGAAQLAAHAAWLARWLMLERQINQLQDLALRDPLTKVWNRRYFDRFFESTLQRAKVERFRVTVMIFDIDDFKSYNDRYGHAAGDDILVEAARLMSTVVRKHDVVARIGGDEFGVIFWDADPPRREKSEHPQSVRFAAERFQRAICAHQFPKLAEEAPGNLSISGGLASFPWDGLTPAQLVRQADECLLASKRKGKNAITFGPGAMKQCGIQPSGE